MSIYQAIQAAMHGQDPDRYLVCYMTIFSSSGISLGPSWTRRVWPT